MIGRLDWRVESLRLELGGEHDKLSACLVAGFVASPRMTGVAKRLPTREKYATKGYNTANFKATIASLGLLDTYTLLCSYITNDFGFVKDTYLIGRHAKPAAAKCDKGDMCNNACYGKLGFSGKMKFQPKEASRSYLNNHRIIVQAKGLVATALKTEELATKLFDDLRVLGFCKGPHLRANALMNTCRAPLTRTLHCGGQSGRERARTQAGLKIRRRPGVS